MQTTSAGQVVLKPKTPRRDGTTHLVMSPLEFMQRLATLDASKQTLKRLLLKPCQTPKHRQRH